MGLVTTSQLAAATLRSWFLFESVVDLLDLSCPDMLGIHMIVYGFHSEGYKLRIIQFSQDWEAKLHRIEFVSCWLLAHRSRHEGI